MADDDTSDKLIRSLNKDKGGSLWESPEDRYPVKSDPRLNASRLAPQASHKAKVEGRLLAIAWFTGIVAAAVVANFIATVLIAAAATASPY